MSDKHYVGLDLTGFEDNGKTRPISRVTLSVDENNVITAGDDTGMELTADCPHATQAMADTILARMKGYQYQMFSADAANIDPAAELGDGVTVGGVYGVVSRLSDDGSGYPGITAPGEAELEDEYPTGGGPRTKAFNRQIAQTRSLISKSSKEVKLEVQGVRDDMTALSSSVTVQLSNITSQVSGYDGRITTAQQTADKISWLVSSGTSSSNFTITDRLASLTATHIDLSGYVTISNIGASGKTTINGGNLTTGIIKDKNSKNTWNLEQGTLVTNSMTAHSITADGTFKCGTDNLYIYLQNGRMEGYRGGSRVGYIDYTAAMQDYEIEEIRYGIQMQASGVVRISSPKISVSNTPDVSELTTHGWTGTVNVVTDDYITIAAFQFINGICVYAEQYFY